MGPKGSRSGRLCRMPAHDQDVLREVMDGLEMPKIGLRKWFAHDRAFCNAHGGERVYPELLSLLRECDEALDDLEKEGS